MQMDTQHVPPNLQQDFVPILLVQLYLDVSTTVLRWYCAGDLYLQFLIYPFCMVQRDAIVSDVILYIANNTEHVYSLTGETSWASCRVEQAMGFCLHNNAAVAALAAQRAGAKKVLIVDWVMLAKSCIKGYFIKFVSICQ